jgi:spore germination protein
MILLITKLRSHFGQTKQLLAAHALAKKSTPGEVVWSFLTYFLAMVCLLFVFATSDTTTIQKNIISPIVASLHPLTPLKESKTGYQVYGYAPYWTFDNLDNVDFTTLTTFAYFGVPLDVDGNLVKDDPGYATFVSDHATQVFKKAHDAGTKVNLTVTLMQNQSILSFLDNPAAQQNAIDQIVTEVRNRGIDGVSVDVEYSGNPGSYYREAYTAFVKKLSDRVHADIPNSQVTVAVYALSARDPQMYDIGAIAKNADQVFMMAYDFAAASSDNAAPTAPLYGYKEGKYPYDIATAVDDFLKVMPSQKLILGVPYYSYNYPVYKPEVNGQTYPYTSGDVQTYASAQEHITPAMTDFKSGWDNEGKISWKAYQDPETGSWRMIFTEDAKSLGIKYDFAKENKLAGIGIWALGFDHGRTELWALLKDKFGTKNLADSRGLLYKEE